MEFGFHREQWSELLPLTIHPCQNPLLPPGVYMDAIPPYIYYIYIYPRLSNASLDVPVCLAHESPTSCPTNQDLSLLPAVMDTTMPDAHAYAHVFACARTCAFNLLLRWCWYDLYSSHYFACIYKHVHVLLNELRWPGVGCTYEAIFGRHAYCLLRVLRVLATTELSNA